MPNRPGPPATTRSTKVKPILKKLAPSEQNSLDLDRPAAEQDALGIYDYGPGSRAPHDAAGHGHHSSGRRGYHNRSTSAASQFSTATSASGPRAGSFIHPFQQTPRPYTPPLAASYQNSLHESDHSHSPAPTEDEDQQRRTLRSASNLSNRPPSLSSPASPVPNTHQQPSLRIQTQQPPSSRIALATSHSSQQNYLGPLSPIDHPSSLDTMTPASTLRTSFDKGFRLRSRSDVDTRDRAQTIQEARRRFQEKEQAKEEKAAREEIRQLEKRNQKEALKIERSHRQSTASDGTRSKRSKSDLTMQNEKRGSPGEGPFVRGHGNPSGVASPYSAPWEDFEEQQTPHSYSATISAKKRTHSAWTKLMMWIRTRFIRIKGKRREAPPPNPYYGHGGTPRR
jgi:hypothetical protein